MNIHKNATYFTFFSLLVFISVSTGFDFYAHSVSYYFYNEQINYSDVLFFDIVQPRYLFLSIIYEIFSTIGIPLGYVALFMIACPVYFIVKAIKPNINKRGDKRYTLFQVVILSFLLFSSFFYSGISLSLLWLFAAVVSRKPIFLLGGLFHPVAIFLSIVLFFFTSRKMLFEYLFLLILFYLLLYSSNNFNLFNSFGYENIRFNLELYSLAVLFIQVLERKTNEILQLLIISVVVVIVFRKSNSKNIFTILLRKIIGFGNRIYFKDQTIRYGFIVLIFILHLYMFQKQSLLNSIYTFDIVNPVYISWFDFGKKDLNIDYWDLYCERYWDGNGC
ncbi:hypothetical protein ACH5BK_10680 [Arcobacter sp. YIC-80]|uniref:hypothetical protein n=1 Tax=Arcobacter sp. YIC-80 TaxID=3376683 RepID=UPI00384AB6D4